MPEEPVGATLDFVLDLVVIDSQIPFAEVDAQPHERGDCGPRRSFAFHGAAESVGDDHAVSILVEAAADDVAGEAGQERLLAAAKPANEMVISVDRMVAAFGGVCAEVDVHARRKRQRAEFTNRSAISLSSRHKYGPWSLGLGAWSVRGPGSVLGPGSVGLRTKHQGPRTRSVSAAVRHLAALALRRRRRWDDSYCPRCACWHLHLACVA